MRSRLLLVLAGVVALVLVVHDVPLARHLERVERDRLVTQLQRDAFILAGRAEESIEDGVASEDNALRLVVTRYSREEDVRVVIVDATGEGVVASDADAIGEDFSNRPEIATVLDIGDPQVGERFSNTLGDDLFFVSVPILSGDAVIGAVRLTAPERTVSDRVAGQVRGIVAVALISMLIAVAVAWLLAASLTRPLTRLRLATEKLAAGDLTSRADESDGPGEIRALALSFNTMAERLSQLVDRQRGFAGTASHQLRTPLTALRLRLEQLGAHTADDPTAHEALDLALIETDRLHRMIEGLLALTRAEDAAAGTVEIDLAAVARARVEHWRPLAEEQGVQIRSEVVGRVPVTAIEGAVEQIVDNLIDNALDVSAPGSEISVTLEVGDRLVELHVVDEGPGMSEDDRRRAFDRFWRGPHAAPGGSGLGLAIVDQLIGASGGSASLDEAPSGGIDAVVRFRVP